MNTPTHEELQARVQQLEAEIIDLREQNQRLREQLQAKTRTFTVEDKKHDVPKVEKHKRIESRKQAAPPADADPTCPLYGKVVCISGKFDQLCMTRDELADAVIRCGAAEARGGCIKSMDYIIFGNDAGPSKMRDVEQWQAEGLPIKVLSQYEIKQILDRYLPQ